MKTARKVTEWQCDAVNCRYHEFTAPKDPPAVGYHGTVVVAVNGVSASWFACTGAHIQLAIETALDRELSK